MVAIIMMVVVLLTMIMITPGKLPIMLMTDAVGVHDLRICGSLL